MTTRPIQVVVTSTYKYCADCFNMQRGSCMHRSLPFLNALPVPSSYRFGGILSGGIGAEGAQMADDGKRFAALNVTTRVAKRCGVRGVWGLGLVTIK